MTKGFIDSQGRLDVNEFDEETMFIEPGQILDPVREFRIFLFQVLRVLVRLSLMDLLVKARFNEEGFTVRSEIIMGNHVGNDFQPYWSHSFSPVSSAFFRQQFGHVAVKVHKLERLVEHHIGIGLHC